jgi:hypothetical protein
MKEFILLLEESKKKQEIQQRMTNRRHEKRFIKEVENSIQGRSTKNLRLTLSSANRISKRIKQINYENLSENKTPK